MANATKDITGADIVAAINAKESRNVIEGMVKGAIDARAVMLVQEVRLDVIEAINDGIANDEDAE